MPWCTYQRDFMLRLMVMSNPLLVLSRPIYLLSRRGQEERGDIISEENVEKCSQMLTERDRCNKSGLLAKVDKLRVMLHI